MGFVHFGENGWLVDKNGEPFYLTGINYIASYVCTERANASKGYSASLFCNLVSPEGGQELVEATLDLLGQLTQ